MAGLVELQITYQRLVAQREALSARFEAGEKNVLSEIKDLSSQIRALAIEIDNLLAVSSSGAIVKDDQDAKANGSNTQSPATPIEYLDNNGRINPPPDTNTSSNAIPPESSSKDSGTDGRIRPVVETQGTPPGASQTSPGAKSNPGSGSVNDDAPPGGGAIDRGVDPRTGAVRMEFTGMASPGGDPGVGAGNDDTPITAKGEQSGNSTVAELSLIDYGKVIPRDNVLNQYASYSYQVSLYLLGRADYQAMVETKNRNLLGAQLLVQSGGASPIGRSNFFSLDYYIDRLDLSSFIAGKGVGLAHNVQTVKMTVVEPNGISFIQNLDKAAEQFTGSAQDKKEKFTQQIYLLVIRFYGYDEQGNLIRGGVNKLNQTSDPVACVEKWYPLQISDVKFKIASKAVEYEITATAVPYFVGASAKYATIPYNIELSGQTLKDMLAGPAVYAPAGAFRGQRSDVTPSPQAPPKADAANNVKKTVRSGLMSALNEYQRDLVADGIIEIPDEYEVEFLLDSLSSAKITIPGSGVDKGATSMSQPGTAGDQKLGSKQSMDPNSRIRGSFAGMQIVQFIDTILRDSTYIRNQQVLEIKDNNKKPVSTGVKTTSTSWYKIGFEATPKTAQGLDKKRNSYAWKIKYTIAPYKLSQLSSPYFNVPLPTGTQKQYRYWFTGQNDSVLSYEETLNNLYYVVLSGADLSNRSANNADYLQYHYQTASGQASVGATGKTNEPGANAADQLYSPADLQDCSMTIVGDPAWLQQGEASLGIAKNDPVYFKPFLADGTINFDSQQILFEVGFNTPQDYNIDTGLIEPKWGNLDTNVAKYYSTIQPGLAQITRTYFAKEVISTFNRGKFTQEIKGSIMPYVNNVNKIQDAQQKTKAAEVAAPVNTTTPPVNPPATVVIGDQEFPVKVPELDPAKRPLIARPPSPNNPLPPNLQPNPPTAPRAPLPLPSTAPPPGSINPVTLLPNRAPNAAPAQLIVKDQ